ncbi:E3 ubiquitin-protein ligase COP1-like protein [Hyaloraphidium curvatum]|nr:E3 ubiquitin-protein ligase COP1-like protein [Hyaloraphidium curvatum]
MPPPGPAGPPACQICLSGMHEPCRTPCGHDFCYGCVARHLQSSRACPVCQQGLDLSQVEPIHVPGPAVSASQPRLMELQRVLTEDGARLTTKDIDSLMSVLLSKKRSLEAPQRKETFELLEHFLTATRSSKEAQLKRLQSELDVVRSDIRTVRTELRAMDSSRADEDYGPPRADDEGAGSGDEDLGSIGSVPVARARKRPRTADGEDVLDMGGGPSTTGAPDVAGREGLRAEQVSRIELHQKDLEEGYFGLRVKDGGGTGGRVADLEDFGSELQKVTAKHSLRTIANLFYGDTLSSNQNSIVSSICFDKDDEFFATAGVTKRIKIFEFASIAAGDGPNTDIAEPRVPRARSVLRRMATNAPPDDDNADEADDAADDIPTYPVREMTCRSKISCLSWNSFFKSQIASADYEGTVTLWDSSTGLPTLHFDEHEKRAWSVDFCRKDPKVLASGSDDSKVKIWTTNDKRSVCTIESKANVCSVKFNPERPEYLAFGSADHSVHLYDIRKSDAPLHRFEGHKKAVSYVSFRSEDQMVTASTDGTLKLWSVETSIREGKSKVVRTFTGHSNERNFVGLSVSADSELIACGSETNAVYVYHHKVQSPILVHRFGASKSVLTGEPAPEDVQFVSSVCWTRRSPNFLVSGNSLGRMKISRWHDE